MFHAQTFEKRPQSCPFGLGCDGDTVGDLRHREIAEEDRIRMRRQPSHHVRIGTEPVTLFTWAALGNLVVAHLSPTLPARRGQGGRPERDKRSNPSRS